MPSATSSAAGTLAPAAGPRPSGSGSLGAMRAAMSAGPGHSHYKWVALSNTTLGMLLATINSSIVLISLPAI